MKKKTQASLLTLPVELLDTIFYFLEPRDIRILRRVNKRLNKISNRFVHCKNEVFCVKKVNRVCRIVELLNCSKRSVFNLHFDKVDFKDKFVMTFFRKHGSKVHSLSFYDCNLSRQLLQDIILNCKALRSFSFKTSSYFSSTVVFDDFPKFEAIVLEEVTSLTLVIKHSYNWLNEPTFRRFISIFPNVTQLDIGFRMSSLASDSKKPSSLTYTSVYNCILQMGKKLKSLRINIKLLELSQFEECFFEALSNLNHLCLNLSGSTESENIILKWRTQLERIPSLEIKTLNLSGPNLLRTLKLQHLKTCLMEMALDLNLFLELLGSEKQTVELHCLKSGLFVPRRIENLPDDNVNTTLTDLTLRFEDLGFNSEMATFPAYFRALVHLNLGKVTNAVLQNIFKHQKNLRSLYLGNCLHCDVCGFIGTRKGDQLSIRELQNLEHLTIVRIRLEVVNARRFKTAFQFPRLKYLNIHADYDVKINSRKLSVAVFASMKNLVALSLNNVGVSSFEELTYLCQSLPNLRYLRCEGFDQIRYRTICILDLSQSSFEDLHSQSDEQSQSYYDEELKKTVLKNETFKCTFFSPKISSFVIDWIVF